MNYLRRVKFKDGLKSVYCGSSGILGRTERTRTDAKCCEQEVPTGMPIVPIPFDQHAY